MYIYLLTNISVPYSLLVISQMLEQLVTDMEKGREGVLMGFLLWARDCYTSLQIPYKL
jgi:hypothetical protein